MDITQIIDDFGGLSEFAREMKVSRQLAFFWRKNNEIPARYWARLIRSARRKKISGITSAKLIEMADVECE